MKKTLFSIESALIAVYAAILVAFAAINSSVWLDEVFSIVSARKSWSDMFLFYHYDVHPPLYYMMLKSTFLVFGESVFAAKMLSTVAAVLTVVCVTAFLKKEFAGRAALVFLLSAIASTAIVLNGVEIRSYSWSLFFVTSSYISVWYIAKTGKTLWYCLFVVAVEGAAFSHYYAAIGAAFIYLLLVGYTAIYDRRKLWKSLLVGLVAILLYLPWALSVVALWNQVVDNYWQKSWNPTEALKYVYNSFAVGRAPALISRVLTVANIALFAAVFYGFIKKKYRSRRDFLIYGSLGAFCFVLFIGIAITLLIRPMFLGKYLFSSTGLIFVFFAIASGFLKNKRVIAALYVSLAVFCVYTVYACFTKEIREERGYTEFREIFIPEADDVFVFPDDSYYLSTVVCCLYPHHTIVSEEHRDGPYPNSVVWDLYETEQVGYEDVTDSVKFAGRKVWVFVGLGENDPETAVNPRFPVPDEVLEYKGLFGYDFYRFKLFYTDSIEKIKEWLPE